MTCIIRFILSNEQMTVNKSEERRVLNAPLPAQTPQAHV